jgi:hypothetical protein
MLIGEKFQNDGLKGEFMTSCASCGSLILFNATRVGNRQYCNNACAANGTVLHHADRISGDVVQQHLQAVHQGNCPKCAGPGPVDVHAAHRVWSAIAMTRWSSRNWVTCRSCGRKEQLISSAFSLVLGWWGFPWGLLMTPVQIGRNVKGIIGGPDPAIPSPALEQIIRLHLAAAQVNEPSPAPAKWAL